MGKTGSESFFNKMIPDPLDHLDSKYRERDYTNDQLVTKNYRQKEKELEAQASLAVNMLNPFTRGPKEVALARRQHKRIASQKLLKERGVPAKPVAPADRFLAYGAGIPFLNTYFNKK